MPTSTSPAVTVGDIPHIFHFDPTFQNVHLPSDCELRFFSETFSLIDSMMGKEILYSFVERVRKTKGVVECKELIELLREENLTESIQDSKEEGLNFLLDTIYRIINKIVTKKFVSCMRTSTLGCIAWEVRELYLKQNVKEPNNNQMTMKHDSSTEWEQKTQAWSEFAVRLQDLAMYQHKSLKIHHDFQKSNYAPDPRSVYAYGSTAFIIIVGFLYLLLKNVTRAEARELMKILSK